MDIRDRVWEALAKTAPSVIVANLQTEAVCEVLAHWLRENGSGGDWIKAMKNDPMVGHRGGLIYFLANQLDPPR